MLLRWILFISFISLLQTLCVFCARNSSLTFVIDDTRSMWDDIGEVRKAAAEIMDIVTREKASEIEDVVLVTFNDPTVLLRIKTSKKSELIYALNEIVAHNYQNYDCPEYALSGIKRALEESRHGSYLFVFTDASAKDYGRLNEVKSLCEKKQSQVVFVLTGDCHRSYSAGFKVYYEIARASGGQVFRVPKEDVKDVLKTIEETVKGQKSIVTSIVVPVNPYRYTPVSFTVDDKTEYVIISTSGTNVDLAVTDQSTKGGRRMRTEAILWKPSGKVVKFDAPAPGTYYVWVKGDTDVSIVIYARTDFTFDHGFSEFVPKSLADASKLPIADRKHYLSISVMDPEHTVDIRTAEILDMNENVVAQLPLKKANGDFYITDTFVSPSTMFKIQVTGIIKKTGNHIRRISKTPIEPQKPPPPLSKAPVVTITEGSKVDIDYNGDIQLTCKVSGYPAPHIMWTSADGTVLSQKSNVVELPYDYISYLHVSKVKNPGSYHCRANNEQGKHLSTIMVNPRSPFRIQPLPGTTPVKYGEEKKLQCDVSSRYPLSIKWTTPLKPSDYILSADKKVLTIKSASLESQGRYSCEATLTSDPKQRHEMVTNVVISDLAPPTISQETPSLITVSDGEPIRIQCKISGGVPRPSVRWQFMAKDDNLYRDLPASGEELTVNIAGLSHAGRYRCIADNERGQADKIAKVIVEKAPVVNIEEGLKKTVAYGSSHTFTCKIIAYPLPKIGWKDSKGNQMESRDIINDKEITSWLNLQNVKVSDKYSCFAENRLGKSENSIDISVPSPIVVNSRPGGITPTKYGQQTDITCDISSAFPLKIRWFFKNGASKISEVHASDKYQISARGTTLSILYTDINTVGKYTCEASLVNDSHQAVDFTTDVQLNDLRPPTLQQTEPQMTVLYKDNVKIPCKIVGGTPPPVISWQVKTNDDSAFRDLFASGEELTVDSATLADAGQYRCVAKNLEGQTFKTTDLVVQMAPVASIDKGASVTVPYGSTNEFKCQIVAYPPPKIAWRDSKGKELHSTNSVTNKEVISRLNIQNIKASETYSCYAENNLGKTVQSVQVLVLPAIDFATHPETTSVKYEKPANILCDAKSLFPMRIKWFYQKNDQSTKSEIHASDKYRISPDGRKLHIVSTALDLVGKYTCEASLVDDQTEKKSFTTTVEINDLKAPDITYSNGPITVMNGQNISAICKANGIPKPDITWEFKSKASNAFTKLPDKGERITKYDIDYELAGTYKCIATSAAGTQSRNIDVTVHGEPKITNEESEYFGVTGDKVLKIPCEVTGVPKPTVTWKHDDKVVTSDAKTSIAENAIFIKNPTKKDSISFICEAKNEHGLATKKFKATVTDDIDWDENLNQNIYLKVGESKNIECDLPLSDSQSIRWYVNGAKTKVLGKFYSISNAQFSNDGNYTCRLNTDQRSDTLNYVVDVGYAPSFDPEPSAVVIWNGNKNDLLYCNVRAKPNGKGEWYYNGKPVIGNTAELAISGWGEYTCKMSNEHGSVQHTFNVTSDECIIDRTTNKVENTPLIIGDEFSSLSPENEFLILSHNQKITLECSTLDQPDNTFKTHPSAKRITAECFNKDKFIVDGKTYKFKELQCKKYVKPSTKYTKKPCMKNGEIIEIGFKLKEGFLGVYEVCYSEVDHKTLYTKVVMSDENMGNVVSPSFRLDEGIKTGRFDEKLVKCRYNQRWLVSPEDVAFGPAQTATLNKFNGVQVFEPCEGSSRLTWSGVEDIVQFMLYTSDKLTAWTGASHYNSRGVPRYLWKLLKFDDDKFETIVYVNDPNPTSSDVLCAKDIPERLSDITDVNDQYTYSCSMDDFLKTFKVPLEDLGITV